MLYLFRVTLHATFTYVFEPLGHSSEQEVVFLGDDKPVLLKPSLPTSHQKRTSSNKSGNNSVQEGDDKEQKEQ